ncbi:23S rRNA (adenine(2503)-C(2))-methyltransferase RlmN [Acetivibrio ethanolgignens]|uniref:Probable dual-specificity RNA methyltransferase RlmN n=1 Tax=Acetivibrio ethanolgignens TaxID=290052 RepID=A0A0V8QDN7_9FIRM|nr:23S rRNA (adenine(2503)-C(2))-methyltransferase RlmN [Acetivibrio ethanolgignens]KSV58687.1 23S rRNA (adenine(2503)-C2)-methyltransferase [Acetivibrio ethanolgignens]
MEKEDIKGLSLPELTKVLETMSEKPFRAKQIYEWLHKKLVISFDEMTNISRPLREKLAQKYEIISITMVDKLVSKNDGTTKFLFRLGDGRVIESVLMKYKHGNSVCISSQVGCRMGCRFCASTLGGLERNLTASEMLSQVYEIQRISGERVSNIVVMGTGEPLDNYDNFLEFVHRISDENGLNISQRNITASTCGLVERIRQLAEKNLQITLAISLHAPNDTMRRELMPVANKYTIAEIMEACHYYYEKTGRRITFEYSLVKDSNDSEEAALELSRLLKGFNCHVNLIPVNPIKERNYRHSEEKYIQKFKLILERNGINVTIRRELGSDINAACGQLRKSYIDKEISEG